MQLTAEPWRVQIRRRPGLFVGDTQEYGRSSLVEILLLLGFIAGSEGHAREVSVVLLADGSCRFSIDGWPWEVPTGTSPLDRLEEWLEPQDPHGDGETPAVMSSKAFTQSPFGDLRVLCALSSPMDVVAWTEGHTWRCRYREGLIEQARSHDAAPRTSRSGLCVTVTPDALLFEPPPRFNVPRLRERIEAFSAFQAGVTWTLVDEATGTEARFHREEGLADLCRDLSPSPLGSQNPLSFEGQSGTTKLRLALVWTEGPGRGLMSWANLYPWPGFSNPHIVGFRQGMRDALSARSRRRGVSRFKPALYEHLTAVLDLRVEGEWMDWYRLTRDRLASAELQSAVARCVADWLEQALAADPKLEALVLKLAGVLPR